jgi:hypothetical protein
LSARVSLAYRQFSQFALNEKLGHRPDDFSLAAAIDISIAGKRRQHMLVSEIHDRLPFLNLVDGALDFTVARKIL